MAYAIVAERNNYSTGSVTSLATSATLTPASTSDWVVCFVKFTRFAVPATFTVQNSDDSSFLTQAGTGAFDGTLQMGIKCFYQKCPTTNATTYTVDFGGTDTCQKLGIYVVEISGLDTVAYLDSKYAVQTTPGTGADAVTTGNTAALASQPACVFGFSGADAQAADPTLTAGTGYTGLTSIWSHFGILQGYPEHKRVTSTTAVAATWTSASSTENYASGVIVLAEPSGTPPTLMGQACL